ncbi:predicted protein, partial [Thalassiosira pseudonana CCMP1335]
MSSSSSKEPPPSRLQIWKLAARPHTLTASIVPVIVGYALTVRYCVGVFYMAVQFAVFAGLIQISTNLHNDYADFVKGADTDQRVGQARATQKGWLSPYETCRGCVVCLLSALVVGLWWLIPVGVECSDPIMIFIVLSSIFNAVAYTGGPFPLGYIGLGNLSIGYSGLGDLFVFLYFGVVATVGVPYLYLSKIGCLGFLATAIIVVNNLRDRHTDIHAGKRTMAVQFGGRFARVEYLLFVVGS